MDEWKLRDEERGVRKMVGWRECIARGGDEEENGNRIWRWEYKSGIESLCLDWGLGIESR